ncbi:arsenate reductase ArsC [Salinispira pacifica]|uniref:Arsenate reductase n=1 Tax=Salinispira pacifica TaxID=1307761 RepID=V5WM57_9SPIO|nr:arsenate reductase ArsC [Salinispira pacifica]AHC16705.1 Arsenate reductase [Salinispira pacifica]
MKKSILIVCIHNSARSQMAEEFFRKFAGDIFEVESAGIEPGKLNPMVVKALKDEDIHIDGKSTQSAFDLHQAGRSYDYVITVCDPEAAERCPIYPGTVKRMHWPFKDPSSFTGSESERLEGTRIVMNEIKDRVQGFIQEYRADPDKAIQNN